MSGTEHLRRAARGLVAGLFGAALLFGWGAGAAHAATIQVNSTSDAPDDELDDGVCLALKKVCTLRAAVQQANKLPGPDTIVLPAGRYLLTRDGTDEDAAFTGDLDIRDDLTITGAGVDVTLVDGNYVDRVFEIFEGVQVSMRSVTIQNGLDRIQSGGGGIRNLGRLFLQLTRIHANTSNYGGGILNRGELFMHYSRIDNNRGEFSGGGMSVLGGTARLERVAVFDNSAYSYGGGISTAYATVLEIASVTIAQNRVAYRGGGLALGGVTRIVNTTISRNTAGEGGGIESGGNTELASVTLKDNRARVGGAILRTDNGNVVGLRNTIVADSVGGGQNCSGTVVSRGYNIDSGRSCGFRFVPDFEGVDVRLGELANNGGFTLTHKPLPGSPAIDAALASGYPAYDQRDVRRPIDGDGNGEVICDIGAVEVERTGG
jgi:CSLREA domain-containing protein